MEWTVVPTGIKELDVMLGGGVLDDSVVLITYDTNSFGWVLSIELFKSFLDKGCFGIVTNYSLPIGLLEKYAGMLDFDLEEHGLAGELIIIDVFGAAHDIRLNVPYVYSPGRVDASTFLPKMVELYYDILKQAGDRKPVGLTVGMDGFAQIFDEETTMKILRRNIMMKEAARVSEDRLRPINIMIVNKDRVSKKFLSWLFHYAEHVIDFEPTERPGIEKMIIRKSLLPDFEPSLAEFTYSKGKIKIRRIRGLI